MRHRHAVDKLWRVEEDGGGGTRVEEGREVGGVMLKGGEEIQLKVYSMHFSFCPDVGDTLFKLFAASSYELSAGTGLTLHLRMEE